MNVLGGGGELSPHKRVKVISTADKNIVFGGDT